MKLDEYGISVICRSKKNEYYNLHGDTLSLLEEISLSRFPLSYIFIYRNDDLCVEIGVSHLRDTYSVYKYHRPGESPTHKPLMVVDESPVFWQEAPMFFLKRALIKIEEEVRHRKRGIDHINLSASCLRYIIDRASTQ